MKILFDLFPVILFFIAFKVKGIYVATAVAIAAAVLQVVYSWVRYKKVDTMAWVGMGVLVVFGGSTLLLHNEMFIKWKPTILYWIFSLTILIGYAVMKKNIIRTLMHKQIVLPENIWTKMNLAWGIFFAVLGAINLGVAYTCTTATWVNFKLFGIMGIMLVFIVLQALLMAPYIKDNAPAAEK
ncbi:MAG: septation protein A [Elusimicrobia bacterium]|nr:septation protein A [Elusimicrobiota bacterium]